MPHQIALSIAVALSTVSGALGQAATTTSNPLNNFINGAQQGAGAIQSAAAQQSPTSSSSTSTSSASPTSSSTSPAAAPATSSAAAAASHGLSNGARIGIIVGCVVGAVVIGAIIAGVCCCLLRRRRHHRRAVSPIADEEVKSWKHHPTNPGRSYSPVAQNGHRSMEQHPTVPLMAAAAIPHGTHSQTSSLSQQNAHRLQDENLFVPDQQGPRRTAPNARAGLTDGMVPGAAPYVVPETQRLRKSNSRSRSNSRPGSTGRAGLPSQTNADRPPTPFGLSGIGRPYEDTHVHVLQTDAPSRELRRSLGARENPFPSGTYDDSDHQQYRNSRGYSTPPEVPSRSPNRERHPSTLADSSYDSSVSSTTGASASSRDQYQRQSDPYQPAQHDAVAPWDQHRHRSSTTPPTSATMTPPPVPWEKYEYSQQRRQSHSPKQSRNSNMYVGADGRRSSRSPATSINGQSRRLRFEDLQAAGANPAAQPESRVRWSQGVGEAL